MRFGVVAPGARAITGPELDAPASRPVDVRFTLDEPLGAAPNAPVR